VTDYLRQRFDQDQIILPGHSWGSFLGIQVAAAAPERYHAYVGMGQVSFQLRSDVAARRFLLEQYRRQGDTRRVRKRASAQVSMTDGLSAEWMGVRDDAMHRLGGGTTRDMTSTLTGVFLHRRA
jgi:pimeloyl-ACP methyl ester carboxylesterase